KLIAGADLELTLVVRNRAMLDERRRVARARTPSRIGPVEPVEDVECLGIDGELVTPRHLEGFRDAQVEPLVADGLVREVDTREIAYATCALRIGGSAEAEDVAEGRSGIQRQNARKRESPRGPEGGGSDGVPLRNIRDVIPAENIQLGPVEHLVLVEGILPDIGSCPLQCEGLGEAPYAPVGERLLDVKIDGVEARAAIIQTPVQFAVEAWQLSAAYRTVREWPIGYVVI